MLLIVLILSDVQSLQAQSFSNIDIAGQANIFGAGHGSTASVGGGLLPTTVSISPGNGRILTFSSVTGTVAIAGAATPNGPDGGTTAPGFTDIDSAIGISGLVHSNRNMFLAGVFLDSSEPADPAPIRLSFTDPEDFVILSPQLMQTFFIGDGVTDASNLIQTFQVPDSATRISLGFIDGFGVTGPPGAYFDNSGVLSANFQISSVPEPSTWMLLTSILFVIGSYRWLRQTNSKEPLR